MTRARMALAAAALFAVALTACSGDPTTDPSGGNTDDAATTPAASPSDAASSPDPLPTGSLTPSEQKFTRTELSRAGKAAGESLYCL